MKELCQSILDMPYTLNASKMVEQIEREVKKYWDEGWVFVKAEPDMLFESICIYFEREVVVDE